MCLTPTLFYNPQALKVIMSPNATFDYYIDGVCFHFREHPRYKYIRSNLDLINAATGVYNLKKLDNGSFEGSYETLHRIADNVFIDFLGTTIPIYILLPCGKCAACRNSYRVELKNRMLIEASDNKQMIFFTLTYDDDNLPRFGLNKKHVSDYLKNVRISLHRAYSNRVSVSSDYILKSNQRSDSSYIQKLPSEEPTFLTLLQDYSIRVVFVGEYGSKTQRAHYHGIIFLDKPLHTLDRHYFFQLLCDRWKFASIFSFDVCKNMSSSADYLSKYITKQELSPFCPLGMTPPFIQTPRHIGLGFLNLSQRFKDVMNSKNGCMSVSVHGKVETFKIPTALINKVFNTSYSDSPQYYLECLSIIKSYLDSYDYSNNPYVDFFDASLLTDLDSLLSKFDHYVSPVPRRSLKKRIFYFDLFLKTCSLNEIQELLATYLDFVSHLYSYGQYCQSILDKRSWFNSLILPSLSLEERKSMIINKLNNNRRYVSTHMNLNT